MLQESCNDESVNRLINTILAGAVETGASEVHIAQFEHKGSFDIAELSSIAANHECFDMAPTGWYVRKQVAAWP